MKVMFDKEKAAQYFIVAWVKNWKLKTYLSAIGAWDCDYPEIADLYPWMPSGKNVHYYFKNSDVRAWCALAMRGINDKLWDTDDNLKRLALAKRVEDWDAADATPINRYKKDAGEHTRALAQNRRAGLAHRASVETMRRGSGRHWGVVK